MIHDSLHPDITVRASLWARSKVRRRTPAALLLSGLILIAAIAPAAATPANASDPDCNKFSPFYLDIGKCHKAINEAAQAPMRAKEAADAAAAKAKQDKADLENSMLYSPRD
jgi:hypothetical protein